MASSTSSGEENFGTPVYGGPPSVVSRLQNAISEADIIFLTSENIGLKSNPEDVLNISRIDFGNITSPTKEKFTTAENKRSWETITIRNVK